MQVSFRLADEDYRALARFLSRETPGNRKARRRGSIGAVVLTAFAAGPAYFFYGDVIAAALVGVLVLLFARIFRQGADRTRFARIYNAIRPRDERRMKEPGTVTLTPDGLEARYGDSAGRIPWRTVTQLGRDGGHIFIIMGMANALVVPQREFVDPEEFEAFYRAAVVYRAKALAQGAGQAE